MSNVSGTPSEPIPIGPSNDWPHIAAYNAIREALYTLPFTFRTDLSISGVAATDLFTFNTSLGASIETQVVRALNETRAIWDAEQNYVLYHFVRQSQRFPDVILRSAASIAQQDIIMGIELKGWYALAKEREPSFRYVVTPAVCAPADLLVAFPWALSNVVSGTPRLFQPYIVGARYAALYRNWHWQHKRSTLSDTGIVTSTMTNHYPAKTDPISDVAKSDGGGNFGRFARTGLMDTYIDALYREELLGIPLGAWQRFLSLFAENRTEDAINRELDRMAADVARGRVGLSKMTTQEIVKRLGDIVQLLGKS